MFLESIKKIKNIADIRKISFSDIVLDLYKNEDFRKDKENLKKFEDSILESEKYFDIYNIIYKVEDLYIKGFITVPKNIDFNKNNKTAVYLRGGNNNYGALNVIDIASYFRLSSILPHMDYVTFFTQYRGEASGEGFDEFGGEDIKDCLTLFDIISELKFCDNNIVVMGHSRGGMMVYQLLRENIVLKDKVIKNNLNISKAIIVAGPADFKRSTMDGWRSGWKDLLLEKNFFDLNNEEELNKRTAVTFYNEIKNIPILIIHGSEDVQVNPQDSIDIHNLLPQSQLVFYKGDNHLIMKNRLLMKKEIWEFLNLS